MDDLNYQKVLCRLHLKAIVPTLCELSQIVPETRSLLGDQNLHLKIGCWGGSSVRISFQDGEVSCREDVSGQNVLSLQFLSERHVNALFQKKGRPLPVVTGAIWQMSKLKTFQRLLELLESYLQPRKEQLQNPDFVKIHIQLVFSMLIRALKEVMEHDSEAQKIMLEAPSGLAEFQIPSISFGGWVDWNRETRKASVGGGVPPRRADARIVFQDEHIALASVRNTLDSMAAIGLGQISISGSIPLAEAFSLSMDRISHYLTPS